MTAWQMLVDRAQIRQGETVLVLAAGSGVGSAAIQIAKLYGARVIATASTDAKLAAARALGADETINHATAELVAEVKRLTEPARAPTSWSSTSAPRPSPSRWWPARRAAAS